MRWAMLTLAGVVSASADVARADDDVAPASWFRSRLGNCPPTAPGGTFYPPGTLPNCPPPGTVAPLDPTMPVVPPTVPPTGPAANLNDLTTPFATQTGAGGLQGRSFNESFDGDFGGVFYSRTIVTGSHTVTRQIGSTTTRIPIVQDGRIIGYRTVITPLFGPVKVIDTRVVHVPVAGRYGGVLITDNDSPRPTDRVYFGYNNYGGFGASLNPGIGNISQNREMVGFEKTVLDGNASIGVRLPFIQLSGPAGVAAQTVGDLSVLFKYAIINNQTTGDVLSVGLVVTTPTAAAGGFLVDGTSIPHSVLLQPWVGFVKMFGRGYVQGISDFIAPTDHRDTLLFSNSLGVGYWLYQNASDRFLTGIIPIAEVHVHTPLNNRDPNGLVYLQDQVNLTTGVHFRFPRAILSGVVSVPVVGPRPWNLEAIVNLNFQF